MNKLRFGDVLAAVLFAAAIVFSFFMIKNASGEKKNLIISACGNEYVYSLEKNGRYEIKGLIGTSVIIVENGTARFEDSPCPNKTCVQSGGISEPGLWAACLPNDVFIRVESKSEDGAKADAVAF